LVEGYIQPSKEVSMKKSSRLMQEKKKHVKIYESITTAKGGGLKVKPKGLKKARLTDIIWITLLRASSSF